MTEILCGVHMDERNEENKKSLKIYADNIFCSSANYLKP